jgi:hypothetical protein
MLKENGKLLTVCATLVFAATVAATDAPAASKIYKTVDKDGNVVFTDVPQGDTGQTVDVQPANTFPAAARPESSAESADASPGEVPSYYAIAISSPTEDLAVRDNAGNLTVSVKMDPVLDTSRGHRLQLLMDGSPHASGSHTSFDLENVDRGTHSLAARVVDADGEVLITSEPVTFHMLRYSKLMRRPSAP